jgi:hypothetical protein
MKTLLLIAAAPALAAVPASTAAEPIGQNIAAEWISHASFTGGPTSMPLSAIAEVPLPPTSPLARP